MPDVKMVPIDAYHWPLTERPVEVREAIESWCAELKPVFLTGCCSEGVYDSRDGGGRVATGEATENNAGDLHGCRKLEQRKEQLPEQLPRWRKCKGLSAAPAHPCARGISASMHVRTILPCTVERSE